MKYLDGDLQIGETENLFELICLIRFGGIPIINFPSTKAHEAATFLLSKNKKEIDQGVDLLLQNLMLLRYRTTVKDDQGSIIEGTPFQIPAILREIGFEWTVEQIFLYQNGGGTSSELHNLSCIKRITVLLKNC